jgi:hypothetical protein
MQGYLQILQWLYIQGEHSNFKHFVLSVLATASSVYTGNVENYGPHNAIDGLVSDGTDGDTKIYHSAHEVQPWFQMEFVEATVVKGVTFTNRRDGNGERFQNVAIHVGDQPAVLGALVTNPECAIFEGPSATGSIEQIYCKEPLVGRFLQVQMRDPSAQILQINEIAVMINTTERSGIMCNMILVLLMRQWFQAE